MLNTFFNAAVCKISDLLPFQGPNFSFFLSFSPAHRRARTHTESHFYQAISADAHPCRSEEPSTAQMTQSKATHLPLFLCLEQKILDKRSPMDCHISLDVILMKPIERNSYYRKQ